VVREMALEVCRFPRPRVLVVDDEANARNALGELLDDAGYDVALAASGGEGLALVDTFHPDVLLTDALMPGMGGAELAARARARPWAPRVVFMSAYPQQGDGAAPWLAKPLRVDELLATIGELLS
jgi:CheY-like chemotaxis protein